MEWTTSLPDWEERIIARRSMVPVEPLFPEVAADAMDVFGALRMVDADGSPLMGEACLPWVNELVAALFGSYDPERRRRLITNYFLMVSKKNGKSMIAAGVMLTALILNTRAAGEFIILAPTKEAADNAYKPIREMILADDELSARFHEQQHIKTVTDRLNNATLKVVAADSATVTGKKAIGVFIDELHEFGKSAKATSMLTEATGGITSRPEGFVFYCTTQSENPPAGVFLDKLNYARKVRDGKVVDRRFLPVIYEFPDHMLEAKAYEDLDNAYITNPNWNVSVDAEVIAQKIQEAEEAGEHAVRDIRAKHLNVQVGMNMSAQRWTGADYWEQNGDKRVTLDHIIASSEVITIGIDGGGLDDLLGLGIEGREAGRESCLLWNRAWVHPIGIERRKSEASKYHGFVSDGDLVIVERPRQDVEELAALCKKVYDAGLLAKIGLDPERTHKVVFKALIDAGIPEDLIIGISQGWKLTGAIAVAELALKDGQLTHADSPMMAWSVGNAKVVPSGNAVLITKQASGTAKIDPLMASLNAITLMATNPEAKRKSVYERRGIRYL
ncbi:terminase large subunit [Comamonas sp. JUb58]|uniref:terminase large subunit n=1 Tax=Comamonas sp. JUb58 TaxID=2485114 RepID=UPI0010611F88|nr:terminase large subunit [Comamonas sp. JUb58]TDS82623.1 phage terminase large subunit-like protein [Comamonas sp. JUb58]